MVNPVDHGERISMGMGISIVLAIIGAIIYVITLFTPQVVGFTLFALSIFAAIAAGIAVFWILGWLWFDLRRNVRKLRGDGNPLERVDPDEIHVLSRPAGFEPEKHDFARCREGHVSALLMSDRDSVEAHPDGYVYGVIKDADYEGGETKAKTLDGVAVISQNDWEKIEYDESADPDRFADGDMVATETDTHHLTDFD